MLMEWRMENPILKREGEDPSEESKEDLLDEKRIKVESGVGRPSRECPYLDTIDRHVLDFDFEKLCSVSLSRINVYACLVCGKYFQGRGRNTHAYVHSVSDGRHRVYLNLETKKFYCLPDNYEIIDSSLADIIYVLNPTFSSELIKRLETSSKEVRAYTGSMYTPGIVGLNNMKANDFCNVVIQALSHVTPIRNYFLEENNYKNIRRPPGDIQFILVQRFGELIRKLWNPKNFKAHVSPHEMLQAVSLASKKTFQFTEQGDSISFISWLLNALHLALGGTKKASSSIIYKTFMGKMRIHTRKIKAADSGKPEDSAALDVPDQENNPEEDDSEYQWKTAESPFLYLTTELPPMPLFRDENYENIIPQVSLYNILTKFNGEREMEYKTYKDNFLKRFEITRLPPFVILYIKRFTKNTFYVEKNHTIVNFPIKSIEFGDLLAPELKEKLGEGGGTYDLLANIVHDGDPKEGTYKVHILHKGSGKWFEMQDLHVDKILPEILPLSEAYIQIYERRASSK